MSYNADDMRAAIRERDRLLKHVERLKLERDAARKLAIAECIDIIETGNYARHVGQPFRADGAASKNDKCVHDFYVYEDCEACAVAGLRALLSTEGERP